MISKTTDPNADGALAESARALLSARAVRQSARRMLELALAGSLEDWTVDLGRLPAVADFVAQLTRERFPRLDVPMHSRWRHFVLGRRDLWQEVTVSETFADSAARARAAFDLAITSVLLDAGAGAEWQYRDAAMGVVAARSEGLALASFRWFQRGGFSENSREPLRADAAALRRIHASSLNDAFQVNAHNPLVGAESRAALLNRLGAAVQARPDLFALGDSPRPGGLFDVFARLAAAGELSAAAILETLLEAFGPIWANRPSLGGVSLGDCWPHPVLDGATPAQRYVPLHKLSQWLAYSLIEPLASAGIAVEALDELTGLPEYRNGGLLVDLGVLVPRNPASLRIAHEVSAPFVVGMRALTVALLDRLAPLVGTRLGLANDASLLARVLEGGTWAAGRRVAREKRAGGGPPFQISSDGTVL